jgi:hypothetical protein
MASLFPAFQNFAGQENFWKGPVLLFSEILPSLGRPHPLMGG